VSDTGDTGAPAPGSGLAAELRRLEEIVRQLEAEDTDLDRALSLFEEGVARLRAARDRLAEADARVRRVLEDAQGSLHVTDLDL
jgi:exodeoxyribonuclease VII small subunit